jgi:predicted ATPase
VSTFLERDRELSVLESSLAGVRGTAGGALVLLGGEAGVGKTALLRRFSESLDGSVRFLTGACEPLFTARPLGPFLDVGETTGGELAALVTAGARPHEVAVALLRELATPQSTVLVLEDLHWADEATLDVLALLGRRVGSVPALVVASFRDDELDRTPQTRAVLGELVGRPRRLRLLPLSPAAVGELAEPYGVDGDELFRRTGGNPFFVTEALGAAGEAIPPTVREAVLARAARLSEEARRLFDAVAIVPGQVELWLLEALAGELVERLDECLRSGMLTTAGGHVAFRHELARLAIEEEIAPHRRVALHRAALAARGERDPDLARLAHHAEAAGDAEAVLHLSRRHI